MSTSDESPYLSRRRRPFLIFALIGSNGEPLTQKDQNQPLDQKTMKIPKCTAYSVAYDLETIMIKLNTLQYFIIMSHLYEHNEKNMAYCDCNFV